MNLTRRYRCLALLAALPIASLLTGCGASQARYTPTSDEARTSLEAALTAWRDGKPYGPIATTPPVEVADSAWQGGQQVESFQIGDEQAGDNGIKQFSVTLKMKKPPGDQSVRYIVHGRDPVRVYREEDYKRINNMDNDTVVPASRSGPGSRRSGRQR